LHDFPRWSSEATIVAKPLTDEKKSGFSSGGSIRKSYRAVHFYKPLNVYKFWSSGVYERSKLTD
jgi:hypothetical protein